jgi:lipase maturation factor 1
MSEPFASGSHEQAPPPPGCVLARWLFLRLLACVCLAAFVSAWLQIHGLIGKGGVYPVAEFLSGAQTTMGDDAYLRFPTLCWLDASDDFLHGLCAGGVALSALLFFGVAPGLVLLLLWAAYLSLTVAGQAFFNYQWDGLLLETLLLAALFAPWSLWPHLREEAAPSPMVRWLLRWLVFRVLLGAGVAKLLSGDESWRDLTALHFHYETQPLPTWTAWFVYQLPDWAHAASVVVMFLAELVLPILLFGSRRIRHGAAIGIIAFQLAIMATGNYGFFNLLVIALCVPLMDDDMFGRLRFRVFGRAPAEPQSRWRDALSAPFAALLLLLSFVPFMTNAGLTEYWPEWLKRGHEATQAFHSVNTYSLFATMTTTRHEIIIEGSDDGATWRPYEFQWKPGDVRSRPEFSGPHMPRLDWQMWFAGLTPFEQSPSLNRLLARLREGSPEVLDLLADNPFPNRPPRLLRAMVYEYHFTDAKTRELTGAWWTRRLIGPYGSSPAP